MLKKRRQIVEEIRTEAYGGMPPVDAKFSENFVLLRFNSKLAAKARINAFELTNLEGITYADDMFYVRFKDLEVKDDSDTGYKFVIIPAQPIGLPRQRAFTLSLPKKGQIGGRDSSLFKMIGRHEVDRMNSLPGMNKVYCYVEDGKIFMKLPKRMRGLDFDKVSLSIATADGGLDSDLNAPAEMVEIISRELVKELRDGILGMPQDLKNDGIESLEPKA
ncbi:hypothetical protein [Sphingobacterium mizutaii]|uniref:hypothetical protein n=1 Tax=Sphingobacterium mizutaii TaxID=1010 RepID=UPI0028A05B77|nr:hypothetical protein [Sphingobacterium mizutaii]